MPNSAACGVAGRDWEGGAAWGGGVCSASQREQLSARLCTLSIHLLGWEEIFFYFFLPDWTKFLLYQ